MLAAEAMRHAHVLLPSLLDADSAAGRDRLHLALAALLRARREAAPAAPIGAGQALALPSKRYNMVSRCGPRTGSVIWRLFCRVVSEAASKPHLTSIPEASDWSHSDTH